MGFDAYPFSVYTAESELDKAESIYKKPSNHSVIDEALNGCSVIITGERGTGKTALNLDIMRRKKSDNTLIVRIDEFSKLDEEFDHEQLYEFITAQISGAFFKIMSLNPTAFWKYSSDERKYLSMYLHLYVPASTKSQLRGQIKKIQHGISKRTAIWFYNSSRIILNYGLKAATKIVSDSLTKHFSALPAFDSGDSEYFKRLDAEIDDSFTPEDRSYYLLEKLCELIGKAKINDIIVSIDKIDEDPRFRNDAERISKFVGGIASNNKIIINGGFKVVLFVWSTPFNMIKSNTRTQKIVLQPLSWSRRELKEVADKRISAFSNGKLDDLKLLFDSNVEMCINRIIEMSNENPRDLWHILHQALVSQFELDSSKKITTDAINAGIDKFVKEFNYYEYYPRKSNARADSMDIYSFAKHLIKLDSDEFTKNMLNEKAGTGGSTNKYVVSMVSMGLIRIKKKIEQGVVIYEIKDPKIRYARQNNIDISTQS